MIQLEKFLAEDGQEIGEAPSSVLLSIDHPAGYRFRWTAEVPDKVLVLDVQGEPVGLLLVGEHECCEPSCTKTSPDVDGAVKVVFDWLMEQGFCPNCAEKHVPAKASIPS